MKLDLSIIALKDFKLIEVFRLKLARYSTAKSGPEYKRKCINPFNNTTLDVLRTSWFTYNMAPILGFLRFIHNINVLQVLSSPSLQGTVL